MSHTLNITTSSAHLNDEVTCLSTELILGNGGSMLSIGYARGPKVLFLEPLQVCLPGIDHMLIKLQYDPMDSNYLRRYR